MNKIDIIIKIFKEKYLLFGVLNIIIATLFISYSKFIYNYIFKINIVSKYIEKAEIPGFSLFFIPVLALIVLLIYLILISKNIRHCILYINLLSVGLISKNNLQEVLIKKNLILNNSVLWIISGITVIIIIIKIIIGLYNKNKKEIDSGIISIDKEISSLSNDLRGDFKYLLGYFIKAINSHKGGSLSLSISGEWGSGKSSFLMILKGILEIGSDPNLKEKIEKDKFIIINFYPWKCSTPESITTTFFTLLASNVTNINLQKDIKKYLSLLIPNKNIFGKLFHEIFNSKNQNDIYDSIDTGLRNNDKKIVVLIDDLDRLEKKELFSVLRIIRNSARLTNIIFITSLDKTHVCSIIDKKILYLEKFFQYDRTIPPLHLEQKIIIFDELFEKNKEDMGDSILSIRKSVLKECSIYSHFTNIREMKNYISRLNMTLLQQELLNKIIENIFLDDAYNYEFKYLASFKLSTEQILKVTLIMIKYFDLIKPDLEYLRCIDDLYKLHDGLSMPEFIKSGEKIPEKYNIQIERYPEFKKILSNPETYELFKIFTSKEKVSENQLNIKNNLLLFFDNYSKYSIQKSDILKYEFKMILNNHENESLDSLLMIVKNPIFDEIIENKIENTIYGISSSNQVDKTIKFVILLNSIFSTMNIGDVLSNSSLKNIINRYLETNEFDATWSKRVFKYENEEQPGIKLIDKLNEYLISDMIDPYYRLLIINQLFKYIIKSVNSK